MKHVRKKQRKTNGIRAVLITAAVILVLAVLALIAMKMTPLGDMIGHAVGKLEAGTQSSQNKPNAGAAEDSKAETEPEESSEYEVGTGEPEESEPETGDPEENETGTQPGVSSGNEVGTSEPEENGPELNPEESSAAEFEESSQDETDEDAFESSAEETKPVRNTLEPASGKIRTPYGELIYPESFADHLVVVNTGEDPYKLTYYARMEKAEVCLFEISFGEKANGYVGDADTLLGKKPMNVVIYALPEDESLSSDEFLTAQAMQEVVNDIMDQMLPEGGNLQQGEAPEVADPFVEEINTTNLEIETPYTTLYYPDKWAQNMRYACDDSDETVYKVVFYSEIEGKEDQQLFSIYFGGDDGEQIGAVQGPQGVPVPVNLIMAELNTVGWSTEDEMLIYSMQEACNQLVEKLPLLE